MSARPIAAASASFPVSSDALKTRLHLEAARCGCSMEETARQILRAALLVPDEDEGGLGSRVHGYFAEADAFDLELPPRSTPRAVPDFSDRRG